MQYFRIQAAEAASPLWHQIATLHIAAIKGGILERIGVRALARLYRVLAASHDNVLIVAQERDKVVGFVSGCLDVGAVIKKLMLSPVFMLLIVASPGFWQSLGMALKALAYPQNVSKVEVGISHTMPELFSIAVRQEWRGHKIGTRLVEELEQWFRAKNIATYRVSTDASDVRANAFYQKTGGIFVASLRHHAMRLNTYHKLVP